MEFKDFAMEPCATSDAYEFIPKKKQKLNITELSSKIEKEIDVEIATPFMVSMKVQGTKASLFRSGKLIVKMAESEKKARQIAEKIIKIIGE